MKVGRIGTVPPIRIYDAGRRPSVMLDYPAPKVGDILSLQEQIQQAELDAALWCAWMRHQRDLLQIILDGMNNTKI